MPAGLEVGEDAALLGAQLDLVERRLAVEVALGDLGPVEDQRSPP